MLYKIKFAFWHWKRKRKVHFWAETENANFECWKVESQPYKDCIFSAGLINDDTEKIYLSLVRYPDKDEWSLYLRRDEALAIAHVLLGALWSDEMQTRQK